MKLSQKYQLILSIIVISIISFHNCDAAKCATCETTDLNDDCNVSPEKSEKDCEKEKVVCYTHKDDKNKLFRGCDVKDFCKDKENCNECPAADKACNTKTISKCNQCVDCAKEQDSKFCPALDELCYTETSGNITSRGCVSERKTPCNKPDCQSCKNTKANEPCNEPAKSGTCYDCRSDAQPDCFKELKSSKTKKCKDAKLGCYAEYVRSGLVLRTCADELIATELEKCKNDKRSPKGCFICTDKDNCNLNTFNGALMNVMGSFILFSSVFLTSKIV